MIDSQTEAQVAQVTCEMMDWGKHELEIWTNQSIAQERGEEGRGRGLPRFPEPLRSVVLDSGWLHLRISWGALKTLLPIPESLTDLVWWRYRGQRFLKAAQVILTGTHGLGYCTVSGQVCPAHSWE